MRMLCVARHRFLSEHLGRYFEGLGMDTVSCVGLRQAKTMVAMTDFDVVICDYDLLATTPAVAWQQDLAAARLPIVAVSLTRQHGDAPGREVSGLAGFLYLPTLAPDTAHRVLTGVRRTRGITPPAALPWPGPKPAPHLR